MDNQQYPNNDQQAPQQPQYQAPQYNQPPQAPNYPQPPVYPQGPVQQPGKGLAGRCVVCVLFRLFFPGWAVCLAL